MRGKRRPVQTRPTMISMPHQIAGQVNLVPTTPTIHAHLQKCACSSLSIGQWCENGKWVVIEDCYPACPLDAHSSTDSLLDDGSEISADSADTAAADVLAAPDSAAAKDAIAVDSAEISAYSADSTPSDVIASVDAADTTAPADTTSGGQVGEQCGGPGEGPCAKSLVCCYPCGIPGCLNKCTVPCSGGPCMNGCPMLP